MSRWIRRAALGDEPDGMPDEEKPPQKPVRGEPEYQPGRRGEPEIRPSRDRRYEPGEDYREARNGGSQSGYNQ